MTCSKSALMGTGLVLPHRFVSVGERCLSWCMSAKTAPLQPLSRAKAWMCVAMNQLAFPGLGTVMAGRKIGYFQAAIMLAGFFLAMGFMLLDLIAFVRLLFDSEFSEAKYDELHCTYGWARGSRA